MTGYTFSDRIIYNSQSILNFIDNDGNILKLYWINTSSNDLIGKSVLEQKKAVCDDIDILYKGSAVKTELDENIVFKSLRTKK